MISLKSLTVLAAVALSVPALAALSIGTVAPNFTTTATQGGAAKTFTLSAALKKGPVVLYFYPAAFTPGCTIEANQFAAAIPQFKAQGATVIGASADTIETLKRFSTTECKKKFAVAVATPAMIASYGVALSNTPRSNRTSFVIAPNGKIIYSYAAMDYRAHVTNTLQAVKDWRAANKK